MKELNELQELIIEWAKEKNLNDPDKQYLKMLEEVGETARAILKNDVPEIKDGIGDIAVTVIIYYWQKTVNNLWFDWVVCIEEEVPVLFCQLLNSLEFGKGDEIRILSEIAEANNTTLKECLNLAWNEIKDRQGKTVNGTFIKK